MPVPYLVAAPPSYVFPVFPPAGVEVGGLDLVALSPPPPFRPSRSFPLLLLLGSFPPCCSDQDLLLPAVRVVPAPVAVVVDAVAVAVVIAVVVADSPGAVVALSR